MSDMVISPNKVFEIALDDAYVLEGSEGTVTIFNEVYGCGTVSITSYKIPEDYDFDMEKELKDFAVSVDKNIDNQTLQVKINSYASSEFITKDKYWKVWTFLKNYYAVFASYNCDEKDRNNEIDSINRMLQSLKILH
jgi:hypothetical protein